MLGFILSCLCRPSSLHSEGFKGRRSLPYRRDLTPVQRAEEAHLYPCYTQSASFQQSQFPSFVVITVIPETVISTLAVTRYVYIIPAIHIGAIDPSSDLIDLLSRTKVTTLPFMNLIVE